MRSISWAFFLARSMESLKKNTTKVVRIAKISKPILKFIAFIL